MEEILLVDKPKGITSMDVIRRLRKELNIKKIGHAGTLDPLATGLMVVGVGTGTKKLAELIKLDKEYIAEIRIGEKRTTGDLEGEIVAEKEVTNIERETVEKALTKLLGTNTYPVSAYSAIKVNGVPMYKHARSAEREGKTVREVPQREMAVYEAELLDFELIQNRAIATVRFFVGSGTYIRSLAEALGEKINYPATLQNLRRTKVGEFDIKKARPL